MILRPEVYFSGGDRNMEPFIDDGAFLRSLVYGVLFHGDLIIPDIFFFISTRILSIFDNDENAWGFFSTCVRDGAAIPMFRKETHGSFNASLSGLIEDRIQGIHSRAYEIANKLDDVCFGKRVHYRLWPTSPISVGFRNTLRHTLLSENISSSSTQFERFWEDTLEIRTTIINDTAPDNLGGLRRGDVFNSLAMHLQGKSREINDCREIWQSIRDESAINQARRLVKWINYCYHFNQGQSLSSHAGLSSLDALDTDFTLLLRSNFDSDECETFQRSFSLPGAAALLTIDPRSLLDLRESKIGVEYYCSLLAYQKHPTADSAKMLIDALHQYTSSLRGLYLANGKHFLNWEKILLARIPAGKSAWGGHVKDIAWTGAKKLAHAPSIMSLAGKVASAAYVFMGEDWQRKLGPFFGMKKTIQFETNSKLIKSNEANFSHVLQDVSCR